MTIAEEKKWFALYTKSRAEKRVAEELVKNKIEAYIPIQKILKQWSDRKKIVAEPLIRSYVFVKIKETNYVPVLKISGVVGFVKFCGKMVAIPEWQIENLKILLGAKVNFESFNESFEKGQLVSISLGVLRGLRGTILKIKNKNKLIIGIDSLENNFIIDIHPYYVEPSGKVK